MKIQDYFSEGFYINLDSRTDREEKVSKILEEVGLHDFVKRYSAVSSEDKSYDKCTRASGTSHRNLMQGGKDSNRKNILIFEDDVEFQPNSIEYIEKSLDSLSKIDDWEIFYFGANIFDNPLSLIDENLLRIDGCYCVHAYAINNIAYDKFLQYNPQVDVPIDAWLTVNSNKKYGTYPLAISQFGSHSDNAGGFIDYDSIFKSCYQRPVNKLFS